MGTLATIGRGIMAIGVKWLLIRSLPALALGVLLAVGAYGCGAAHKSSGSSATTSPAVPSTEPRGTTFATSFIPRGQRLRGDGDADNPSDIDGNGDDDKKIDGDDDYPTPSSYKFPDKDDKESFAFGHPPSAAARRTLTSFVKRYYRAAAAEDGTTACSLLLPALASSTPEDYGGATGPAYLRGAKTCRQIMKLLFKHLHAQLTEAVSVVEVRVKGADAQVILSSRRMPASEIQLELLGGMWKSQELIGQALP
jgi:hypothetical protein